MSVRALAWPASVGVVSGGLTVAVAELGAALLLWSGRTAGTPSPVLALGAAFIDRTPLWLKNFAVDVFGTADKTALLIGIALVVIGVAATAGVLAQRQLWRGFALVLVMTSIAAAAVLTRPNVGPVDVVPVFLGAFVGLLAMARFTQLVLRIRSDVPGVANRAMARRSFLIGVTSAAALSALGGVAASALAGGARAVQASRAALRLPRPIGPVVSTAQRADLAIPGASRVITPVDQFYRIDTALSVPQVSTGQWRLRIHGLVRREVTLDFDDLLALPMVERMITLSCVSNEVGGSLVGNQVWLGHPVRELLARAEPLPEADMVLSTSSDGWTAGTPLEALTDANRDALLAIGMGGQPLPLRHGFPARLVVPGLYGYVSATKWVVDLEVTRFDRDQGYWTPRGWSTRGPIKTQSRIDVPRGNASISAGRTAVAGVAWAPHRGIRGVEVRVGDGPWQVARLGDGGTQDTWRQWVWTWDATPGQYRLQVRATDDTGETQTEQITPTDPDGATGWHTITVTVNEV
ncbi:MAG: molybdopterin-dependent oxidoreductase [Actinomycetota bacterium]